jgi:hypothetical protein
MAMSANKEDGPMLRLIPLLPIGILGLGVPAGGQAGTITPSRHFTRRDEDSADHFDRSPPAALIVRSRDRGAARVGLVAR